MQNIRILREFEYNGRKYYKNQLVLTDDQTADYLVYRHLAEYVSIAPGTPVVTPLQGETKELKKETVKKAFPVSKRK